MSENNESAKNRNAYKYSFNRKNYDTITFYIPKGQREVIYAHAAERGESANAFVNRAVAEQMKRDQALSQDSSDS